MKKKNHKRLWISLAIIVVLAVIMVPVGRNLYNKAFYGQAIDNEIVVRIDNNTTYDDLKNQIRPSLRSFVHRLAFDIYASRLDLSERYSSGEYTFSKGESVVNIVRKLVLETDKTVKLIVGEARTLPQLAGKLAKQIDADAKSLLETMRNKQIRKELGYVKDSTIAMFIPNTYEVYRDISPEDLLRRMSRENSRFWNEERTEKLKRCNLSKYEVMTLASIVYEETKLVKEMPIIAGVYINRLKRNMRLQACPTAKYAVGDFSLKRILDKHIEFDSPFNTYKYEGLPPAPICIPSIEAIDAVLNYEEHKYLYFCASPKFDGTNVFAKTYTEHKANARKYRKALDKLGIK
jgi:UPF0755 protein